MRKTVVRACVTLACGLAAGICSADVVYIVSNTTNEIYKYDVPAAGTVSLLATVTNPGLERPFVAAFRGNGEMLVNDRGPCSSCVGGGLTRLFAGGCGNPTNSGATATGGLRNPHGLAIVGDIAYMIDAYNDRVARYSLSGSGAPVEIGSNPGPFSGGTGRCLAVRPVTGELFLSNYPGSINRLRINPDGSLTAVGSIQSGSLTQCHGMAFAPDGELFVALAVAGGGGIGRYRFDANGNAVANGTITGNGLNGPVNLAFMSTGELLASNSASAQGTVCRFQFDANRNAIAAGTFSLPTIGLEIVPAGSLPAMVASPPQNFACNHGTTSLTVVGTATSGFTFVWRRNGTPISLGNNATAHSSTLVIQNSDPQAGGSYDCVVTMPCGSVTSNRATVTVCPANFNCDGALDLFDYLDFVDAFASNGDEADFNSDSVIDFFDYLDFVDAFSGGC